MTISRRTLIIFLTLFAFVIASAQIRFTDETLNYRVTYKWGLIQKQAGSASLKLRRQGDVFNAILTASTMPWADRIFQVRDTLVGTMEPGTMHPLLYDKSTHEGGVYRHDIINYTYTPTIVTAHCERFKLDKKGAVTITDTVMSAHIPGVDMLSVYYFVRAIPYETMKPGDTATATIFSGKKKEALTITYTGQESIKLNDTIYNCYKIDFLFSSERMKNSSAPMKAWIRRDGTRIPVKLQGELPVGKIQVLWNGK